MTPYEIRPATLEDLEIVLHHRRRMFEDMGFTDAAVLGAMLASSTPLLRRGLADGSYRGWLVELAGPDAGHGRGPDAGPGAAPTVVAGGGVITLTFQSHPIDPRPQRAWVVNMFTEPAHRRRGLA